MVYQWGRKVTWTGQQQVSENTEFQVGEYGRMTEFALATDWSLNAPFKDAEEITRELADTLKREHNAELLYINMDARYEILGDRQRSYYEIHELIFKGSPIAPAIIALALVIIIIATIVLAPVIWKLAGVSVGEIIGYSIGPLLIIGGVVVAAIVVVPLLMDAFKGKKGRKR